MRGIAQVVKLPNAVAVIADRFWRAKEALGKLPIEWDFGADAAPTAPSSAKPISMRSTARRRRAGTMAMSTPAMTQGARVVEAVYEVPHLAHAPMEPLNCTAHVQPDRVDVWIGTQNAEWRARSSPRRPPASHGRERSRP